MHHVYISQNTIVPVCKPSLAQGTCWGGVAKKLLSVVDLPHGFKLSGLGRQSIVALAAKLRTPFGRFYKPIFMLYRFFPPLRTALNYQCLDNELIRSFHLEYLSWAITFFQATFYNFPEMWCGKNTFRQCNHVSRLSHSIWFAFWYPLTFPIYLTSDGVISFWVTFC